MEGTPKLCAGPWLWQRSSELKLEPHPGFPDLMGFGRRNMDATLEEIQDDVVYQIGALQAFARVRV